MLDVVETLSPALKREEHKLMPDTALLRSWACMILESDDAVIVHHAWQCVKRELGSDASAKAFVAGEVNRR